MPLGRLSGIKATGVLRSASMGTGLLRVYDLVPVSPDGFKRLLEPLRDARADLPPAERPKDYDSLDHE